MVQAGGMVLLFLVCGILAGFAAYRFGAARASMRRLNTTKNALGTARKTAWRHSGVAVLFIAGVVLLLYVAGRLGGLATAGARRGGFRTTSRTAICPR